MISLKDVVKINEIINILFEVKEIFKMVGFKIK